MLYKFVVEKCSEVASEKNIMEGELRISKGRAVQFQAVQFMLRVLTARPCCLAVYNSSYDVEFHIPEAALCWYNAQCITS